MANNKIVIIVPVYSETLRSEETASFKQTLFVFSNKYDIKLVTYEGINLSAYYEISNKCNQSLDVEYFDKDWFKNVKTYSDLLMNLSFYKRFSNYDYMLITQLDVWVFYDNLIDWINKGYDYVGAPWFVWDDNKKHFTESLSSVGNGGFSLRRVRYFTNIFSGHKLLWNFNSLIRKSKGTWKKYLTIPLRLWGWHNNMEWYVRLCKGMQEDMFWCISMAETDMRMNVPTPIEAAHFSFEVHPELLYNKIGKLPMGCHAFLKWDFDSFWSKYIQI